MMNCRTCQYELSQCLDGRLPSGRRALVMAHIAECSACSAFNDELKAAQRLVLQLPRVRVGADFRDGLFERIATGEGTPTGVFHEHVSVATRVRYLMTGAAAAAAVLVTTTWILRDDKTEGQRNETASVSALAHNDAPERVAVAKPTRNGLRDAPTVVDPPVMASAAGLGAPFAPTGQNMTPRLLNIETLAVETARRLERSYGKANDYMHLHDRGVGGDLVVRKICDEAADLRDCGAMLLELNRRSRISFQDPEVTADLRVAVELLDDQRLQDRSNDTVRTVIGPALQKSQHLGTLTNKLFVQPTIDMDEQLQEMIEITRTWSTPMQRMFVLTPTPLNDDFRASGLRFRLDDPCGPVWVVPVRELRERK